MPPRFEEKKTMKTLILILLVSSAATAQTFTFHKKSVTMKADSLTVEQSFEMISILLPVGSRYFDRYVIKDGRRYFRPAFGLFRKPRTYQVVNGALVKLRRL